MTTTTKGTLKYLGAFVAVAGLGIGGLFYAEHQNKIKAEAEALQLNEDQIASCIKTKGQSYNCGEIDLALADEETKQKGSPFIKKFKDDKAAKAAETRKKNEEWRKKQAALKKERERAAAEADAKFKAEGWWEADSGVFLRWCEPDSSCPGRAQDHYTDSVWRAMVWCKERACGEIYARMNILNGDTVVGWTNETAYGGYGQKVVLTFGSHIRGTGRIVEFKARG